MALRFRNPTVEQLDLLSTTFGAIAGIAELLVACKYISNEHGQLVAGLAIIAWGFFSNKPPRIPRVRMYQSLSESPNELLQEL